MAEVMVTGSSGFIGRAVVKELKKLGHKTIEFDRANGKDLLNPADVIYGDAVIHLAGVLGTSELFDRPSEAVDVNVKGTLRVLDAARLRRMAYVGITMPQVFPSIYTATKICATKLATAYHVAYGTKVSHVRAFNAFGKGQAHGSRHPRKILPALSTEAWQGKPLIIWGDGTQKVDLIDTDQLAKMLVRAINFGEDEVIDGGTGISMTVNEVAASILEITGSKSEVEYRPMRKGELPTDICATGEGWELLGWTPKFNYDKFVEAVKSYK